MITKYIKNCLVTGGAGFIGSHLTRRLLEEGSKVVVLDDLSEGKWENLPDHPNLTKHKGSILDDVSNLVKGKGVIFHLAALPRLQRSVDDPWTTHKVNVDGTLNLLLAARKHKVKKFIFSSSSSVYGNKNKIPFNEKMAPNPLVPYSLQKVMAEEYCRLFSDIWGVKTISLRYFNVYGPGMNPDGAYATLIPRFIKAFKNAPDSESGDELNAYMSSSLKGNRGLKSAKDVIKLMSLNKIPVINGDGNQTRDFTYISDVVEANILAAKSPLSGEVFNIGFGKSVSVNEVVRALNLLMGKKIKPKHGPALIESRASLASNTKARKILGWKPKVSFKEGLKKILAEKII